MTNFGHLYVLVNRGHCVACKHVKTSGEIPYVPIEEYLTIRHPDLAHHWGRGHRETNTQHTHTHVTSVSLCIRTHAVL